MDDKYDDEEVYSRFLNLRRRFSDEDEPIILGPNLKEKVLPTNDKCGIQLWGIGYWSAGEEDEDYDSEEGLDEDDMLEMQQMYDKLEQQDQILDQTDMELISNSSRLLDKYRNRWWSQNIDAYFVQTTESSGKFKPGEQVYGQYGPRSNSYFLEK